MTFEGFTIVFGWFSAAAFVAVSAFKIVALARLPMNLRWEVYPVPHEAKDKRRYGGSYMEEVDWASKTRTASQLPAYLEMATEILTLSKVRENNTYGIWPLSLAMHWGLYLYFGWLFLLVLDNLIGWPVLAYLTTAVGLGSFALGAFGSLALIVKRATNEDLARYTTPLDFFNLLFIASFFVVGLGSSYGDVSFAAHRAYIGSVLFLRPAAVPFGVAAGFFIFEAFVIYMPFTKLLHYFAKYFTFDLALWDDAFKVKGSATDRKIVEQLAYTVDWSAPHIAPGKTWLEQAETTEGERK